MMSGCGAHYKNIPSYPIVVYHPYTWEHYSQYNYNNIAILRQAASTSLSTKSSYFSDSILECVCNFVWHVVVGTIIWHSAFAYRVNQSEDYIPKLSGKDPFTVIGVSILTPLLYAISLPFNICKRSFVIM